MSRIIPLAAGALAAAMLLPATTQVVSAKEYLIRYSDIGANRGPGLLRCKSGRRRSRKNRRAS